MIDLENAIIKLEQIKLMLKFMTETSLTDEEKETAIDILQQIAEPAIDEVQQRFYSTARV